MVDKYDDDSVKPSNARKIPEKKTAVALKDGTDKGKVPEVIAAGRGEIAGKILQIAWENGIDVREDSALAEMLAKIELDSPIPSEAFMAVAEILAYVYKANGRPDPFNVVLKDVMEGKE